MKRYQLIALDIDGTLLNSRGEITPAVRRAVARAQQAGIMVTLATGRPMSTALPIAETLGINAPLVVSNGAVLAWPNPTELIHVEFLDSKVAVDAVRLLRAAECPAFASRYSVAAPDLFYEGETAELGKVGLVGRQPQSLCRVGDLAGVVEVMQTISVMTLGETAVIESVAQTLKEGLEGKFRVLVTPEHPGYSLMELSAAGISKAAGLARLISRSGLSPIGAIAIGDNLNDLEMLQFVGMGVAMGNALPEVKAVAQMVTTSNDEDGVAQSLDQLLAQVA